MQELFEANHWGNGRQAKFLDLYNAWEAANQIEKKGIIGAFLRKPQVLEATSHWII